MANLESSVNLTVQVQNMQTPYKRLVLTPEGINANHHATMLSKFPQLDLL